MSLMQWVYIWWTSTQQGWRFSKTFLYISCIKTTGIAKISMTLNDTINAVYTSTKITVSQWRVHNGGIAIAHSAVALLNVVVKTIFTYPLIDLYHECRAKESCDGSLLMSWCPSPTSFCLLNSSKNNTNFQASLFFIFHYLV